MRIIFTGGGTLGSVSPLLAIYETFQAKQLQAEFIWIGTEDGPEKETIERAGLKFYPIKAGKLRRYLSLQNLFTPFQVLIGRAQAKKIIQEFQPDLILSAGGFVAVPVIAAAHKLGIKSIIHQQDRRAGLANKLCAKKATKVTVSFEESLADYPAEKTILTGNPVRPSVFTGSKESAITRFQLEPNLPTLLIMGGSLGAEKINQLVADSVTELIELCQIIHVVGRGHLVEWLDRDKFEHGSRYHIYEFFTEEMADAYAAADLVVCRAGLSTLTEITALLKPAIVIPIPQSHQMDNLGVYTKKNAVIYLDQNNTDSSTFSGTVQGLFDNPAGLANLSRNIKDTMPQNANDHYLELIIKTINK